MTDEEISIFQGILLVWYDRNMRSFPWRYIFNPYKVLISEVLLQQTNVEKVILPYYKIINQYKSIAELACADIKFLKDIFKYIGLFYRADRLINISKEIMNKYGGNIPNEWDQLIKIKGVGRYICSAVLCFGFNKPYAVLDTNVIRIFERVLGVESECTRPREDMKLWEFAQMLLPEEDYVDYNYALLDFAAEVCTATNPKCTNCYLKYICLYSKNKQ